MYTHHKKKNGYPSAWPQANAICGFGNSVYLQFHKSVIAQSTSSYLLCWIEQEVCLI